ncbi:unnamed protein product [Trichobilharzia regenti]|nr:unnamed protein product [Trichobilharzia regenti]
MESAACITKYSPISVEQEPLDDSVYQSSVPAKRDLSPRTSPGRRRKRSRHNRLSKTHLPSDDMNLQTEHYITNETLSHGGITTIDSRQQQQQQFDLNSPSSSSSLLNTVGKRRRHAHHSAISNTSDAVVAAADDDEEFAQQSVSPLETSISDACDILSTSTPSSLPNNLRRSSSSRHSVLPPRKRYKVGINTSDDADTHMSSILDSDHPTDDCIKSMSDEQPTTDITVVDLTEVVPSTVDVGQLVDNPDTSVVVVKKRGRGRPSRRSLKLEPINKSIATSPCLSSDSVSVMSDRPKREAAVIGFASLVAANLNNTGVSVNSTPETPDTLNVRSETSSLPSPSVSVSYTEHQHQQQQQGSTVEVLATKPVVAPRGRGRPPKIKPTHLLNTNSTLSPSKFFFLNVFGRSFSSTSSA